MHALLTKVGHFKIGINSGMAKISFYSRILWFIQKYAEDFRKRHVADFQVRVQKFSNL